MVISAILQSHVHVLWPVQLIHVLFDPHMQYKNEGENFNQKL